MTYPLADKRSYHHFFDSAISEQTELYPDKRIFAQEINSRGSRGFILSGVNCFWDYYTHLEPKKCHEVIQPHLPVRLYFDLEFYKKLNPGIDGDQMLEDFIPLVNDLVSDYFGLNIDRDSWLLLDSSSAKKFSVHAIVHLPYGSLFASNLQLKQFIKVVVQRMKEEGFNVINSQSNQIKPKGTFLDEQVYSKNRQMRMFLSTKSGRTFRLSPNCSFYRRSYGNVDVRDIDSMEIFKDSLIVPADYRKCHNILDI